MYYFYNLMPLTRGSSVAAYSVAMGLILSLGWEVQGKIPTGKVRPFTQTYLFTQKDLFSFTEYAFKLLTGVGWSWTPRAGSKV